MQIVRFLVIFQLCIIIDGRFTFYHTDDHQGSYSIFDCIYAYLDEDHRDVAGPYSRSYYLIPYCRLPDTNEITKEIDESNMKMGKMISFNDLNKLGVTSAQLLEWMAPISVAERYEKYSGDINKVFYNCSSTWFGSKCQYKFDFDTDLSFGEIVNATFASCLKVCRTMTHETCFPFVANCSHGPSPICLDWREICDGKFDCINGEDEELCEQLELNECTNEEYRCHYGGQCIPLAFLGDGGKNIDCLDASDEIDATILFDTVMNRLNCHSIPTFVCEERICRYSHSFSCGNGECTLFYVSDRYGKLCFNRRRVEITRLLLTSNDNTLSVDCQQALLCLIRISNNASTSCSLTILNNLNISHCKPLAMHCFSEWIAIPTQPILFGFFQFIYLTNRTIAEFQNNVLPNFVCFNPKHCPGLSLTINHIELNNGLPCCHISDVITEEKMNNFDQIEFYFKDAIQRCLTIGAALSCSHPSLFHCSVSRKCISYHRLVDGFNDCYFGEDESYLSCQLNDSSRFVCSLNSSKCLSNVAVGNLLDDCPRREDELTSSERWFATRPAFSYICNGRKEPSSVVGDGIDEKNCQWWPCNTPYVRCNNRWDCFNGVDELNCSNSKCLPNEHECLLQENKNSICLPMEYLFDKYLDHCPINNISNRLYREIYFDNHTEVNMNEYISWNKTKCITVEKICRGHSLLSNLDEEICRYQSINAGQHNVTVLLTGTKIVCKKFATDNMQYPIPFASTSHLGFFSQTRVIRSSQYISRIYRIIPAIDILRGSYCNRGILVQYSSNKNSTKSNTTDVCLCPPSYFGSRCQWQNQRISLTLKLVARSATSSKYVFQVIIMLINQDGLIASNHEQITFVPIRDCSTKFNIYLLYPDRPKRLAFIYSIPILPVNRFAAQLFISEKNDIKPCPLLCGNHGRCRRYENKNSSYFCKCDPGYSGTLCNITHPCQCSSDSLCISSSICICRLHEFGEQCYLKNLICQPMNNPCKHNGLCIPNDDRITEQKSTCLCTDDYSGATCEIENNRIDIQYNEAIIKTISTVLVHFITIFEDKHHERTTTFKKILVDKDTITLYVHQPFHIVFTEFDNKAYYLAIVRETYIKSENITTQIQSNQRCRSINELLNATLIQYDFIDRVKYYPMICEQHKQLMCFYDEIYLCLCDLDRFSNCFEFNHNVTYNCQGRNDCENDGRCFENNATCPTVAVCICQECYYGIKCQFSTKGFIFSLDPILGYQIKPNISINRQSFIVKLSITIITCMHGIGLISGLLSIITFRRKQPREVGCGWYLLYSSSVSVCTLTLLTFKFWNLVLYQTEKLNNRSFLSFTCIVTDASLKMLLTISEWLNACVGIERMFTVRMGINFNKANSKRIAKRMTFVILLLAVSSYLHDPFHYKLIDDFDTDEKRTWCFVRYSYSVATYNSFINLFHFIAPFSINLISAVVIIILTARRRCHVQPNVTFLQHLQRQFKQHKHVLIAPCLWVLLSLPRLIIPFTNTCMKSPRDPLIFLIWYFISFIPMTLHFYLYVWPSKYYMKEFNTVSQQTMRRLRLYR